LNLNSKKDYTVKLQIDNLELENLDESYPCRVWHTHLTAAYQSVVVHFTAESVVEPFSMIFAYTKSAVTA